MISCTMTYGGMCRDPRWVLLPWMGPHVSATWPASLPLPDIALHHSSACLELSAATCHEYVLLKDIWAHDGQDVHMQVRAAGCRIVLVGK